MMMHQGALRVALCFLAKFGVFHFFVTSVVGLASVYLLLSYFTSMSPTKSADGVTSSRPAVSARSGVSEGHLESFLNHVRLTSNMKYQQASEWKGFLNSRAWSNYGRDLMTFVNLTSMLPACHYNSLLTIFITSAPRNFKHRDAIRKTWCSENVRSVNLNTDTKPGNVQCVFLLGKTLSKNIQASVELEAQRHSDILRGTYLDTYRNLTLKVLNGFHWGATYCPSSYVLKTDDDCFVNVPVLKKLIEDQQTQHNGVTISNTYVGHVLSGQKQQLVIRDPRSKWEVSEDDFSSHFYPPYVSGSGYLLSQDLLEIVVALYSNTYLIPVEDAYIGILMNSIGISPVHSSRFGLQQMGVQLCNLMYYVVIHRIEPEMQTDFMSRSRQSYVECKQHQPVFDWS